MKDYGDVLISIIVPIFNVEKYVKKALESLLRQTYKNIEIICINDGSNDTSLKKAHEIGDNDKRVKWLDYQDNQGLAFARNRGLECATGKYVLFLDSDDYLLTDAIQHLLSIAESNLVDFVLYRLEYKYENDWLEKNFPPVEYDFGSFEGKNYNGMELIELWDQGGWPPITSCTGLFCVEFLKNNDIKFTEGILHEDVLFINKCIMAAKYVRFTNRRLYVYVRREQSITTSKITDKNIKSFFIIACKMVEFFLHNDFPKQYYLHIAKRLLSYIWRPFLCYTQSTISEPMSAIRFGNELYDKIFSIYIQLCDSRYGIKMSPSNIEKIKKSTHVIIYGAGSVARSAVKYLSDLHVDRFTIVVTESSENQYLAGNKVRSICELNCMKKEQAIVLLAVHRKDYQMEIIETLHAMKFNNIIII